MATQSSPPVLRILVADDNEAVRKMFSWMIEIMGHDVRVANDGNHAIAEAKSFRPHVIMLDISLPDLNGHEVCKVLRLDPAFQNCIIIAQTGHDRPDDIERSKQAGFDHHWVKPIHMERLENLLTSLNKSAAA